MAQGLPSVRVEDLTFAYEGGPAVLQKVSFSLRRGDFLVVLGANGAGKTTLCYLLSGVIPHIWSGTREGQVEVTGIDPWTVPMYEMAGRTGIVLQDPDAQLAMPTVAMELAFGPANLGIPREAILDRTQRALRAVGLEGFEGRTTQGLSGGQKQRVALASALTLQPQVLILDEPTSQLDPLGRQEVLQALQALQKEDDLTVVMTTHDTEDLWERGIGTHALVLREGKAAAFGPLRDVLSQVDLLEEAGIQPPPQILIEKIFSFGDKKSPSPSAIPSLLLSSRGSAPAPSPAPFPSFSPGEPIPSPMAIEVDHVSVTYPGPPPVAALKGVSLAVREGEFIGLVGQNGSGKSTLVKALVGLVKPQEGSIRVLGKDIRHLRVGQMATRIGLVLQNPDYQLFSVSALEEVMFGLRNLGISPREAEERAWEALRAVGLEHAAQLFPFRLSFGDRRKLAVAAVLAMDPPILILDEPTTAQDYRGRYALADLAMELHEKGKTVLMITHDMNLVARYARRLVVMKEGMILLDGPSRDVFGKEAILAEAALEPPAAFRASQRAGLQPPALTLKELLTRQQELLERRPN